jgi:hypothetical protein
VVRRYLERRNQWRLPPGATPLPVLPSAIFLPVIIGTPLLLFSKRIGQVLTAFYLGNSLPVIGIGISVRVGELLACPFRICRRHHGSCDALFVGEGITGGGPTGTPAATFDLPLLMTAFGHIEAVAHSAPCISSWRIRLSW